MDTIISGILFNHYQMLYIQGNTLEDRLDYLSNYIKENVLKWEIKED
jgi:hypothetical protein